MVPRLQPEIVHRVIDAAGLEGCADFVAHISPRQLSGVLDLDLWRPRGPGTREEFDADRFGLWIAVLMECGAEAAAEKRRGLDVELVAAGLSPYTTLDGEHVRAAGAFTEAHREIGGYLVAVDATPSWEPIVDLLVFLEAGHPAYFHSLMRECVRLSHGVREHDGLHGMLEQGRQQFFDLLCDRDERRERQGYISVGDASAFLRGARDFRIDDAAAPPCVVPREYRRASFALTNDDAISNAGVGPVSSDDAESSPGMGVFDVMLDTGLVSRTRGLHRIDPTDFTFISANGDIRGVRDYMRALPSARL